MYFKEFGFSIMLPVLMQRIVVAQSNGDVHTEMNCKFKISQLISELERDYGWDIDIHKLFSINH